MNHFWSELNCGIDSGFFRVEVTFQRTLHSLYARDAHTLATQGVVRTETDSRTFLSKSDARNYLRKLRIFHLFTHWEDFLDHMEYYSENEPSLYVSGSRKKNLLRKLRAGYIALDIDPHTTNPYEIQRAAEILLGAEKLAQQILPSKRGGTREFWDEKLNLTMKFARALASGRPEIAIPIHEQNAVAV